MVGLARVLGAGSERRPFQSAKVSHDVVDFLRRKAGMHRMA